MRELFFYILSFIFTVVFALSGSATAFSSDLEEKGPKIEVKYLETIDSIKKKENLTLVDSFQKTPPETVIYSRAVKPTKETPIFTVTDYLNSCDNVNCFVSKDAERGIIQFQNTFFYGHSTIAFNRLKTVYIGDEIIVKDINGTSHRYKIIERMVRARHYLNGDGKSDGFTAGIYTAEYNGNQYSAAFMTCGNGSNDDSNYRLILFAVEI